MNFFTLTVSKIIKETADAVSIEFHVPEELKNSFFYIPGQYITIKLTLDGEYRRSYSICSNPFSEENLKVAVKHVKDGLVSAYLNRKLEEGDQIEVSTPNGRFYTDINEKNALTYVFFAGGSGITPIISIIKGILQVESHSKIILFYGNLDEKSIIFKNELDLLSTSYSNFKVNYLIEVGFSENEGFLKGRLTRDMVETLLPNFDLSAKYFICGPTIMMQNVEDVLSMRHVPQKNIHVEYFSPVPQSPDIKEEIVVAPIVSFVQDLSVAKQVKVIIGGMEVLLSSGEGKKTILDLALEQGLDAPFSCKEAICCSCRAKVLEGKVKMKNNYALTDDEVEDGYVLTCQSMAISQYVVISYDA